MQLFNKQKQIDKITSLLYDFDYETLKAIYSALFQLLYKEDKQCKTIKRK